MNFSNLKKKEKFLLTKKKDNLKISNIKHSLHYKSIDFTKINQIEEKKTLVKNQKNENMYNSAYLLKNEKLKNFEKKKNFENFSKNEKFENFENDKFSNNLRIVNSIWYNPNLEKKNNYLTLKKNSDDKEILETKNRIKNLQKKFKKNENFENLKKKKKNFKKIIFENKKLKKNFSGKIFSNSCQKMKRSGSFRITLNDLGNYEKTKKTLIEGIYNDYTK